MIGESSGVSTLLINERITRESQVQEESSRGTEEHQNQQQTVSDVTTFSAEALALSKEVVPTGQASEQGATEQQGRGQEEDPAVTGSATTNFLDIRV